MKIASLLLLTLLTIAPSLLAQTFGVVTGRLTERVTGQPIVKAKITLENNAEAETDADGRYRIELAPAHTNARSRRTDTRRSALTS